MSGKGIKVTDKRMFTQDGELRDEYRFLDERKAERPAAPPGPEKAGIREVAGGAAAAEAGAGAASSGEVQARPDLEIPGAPTERVAPTFFDLVGILAEPVSVYLGDTRLPDGKSAENLDLARIHIDLLELLGQKTAGNLTAEEAAVLEDLIYRLRLRYVQKRG